MTNTPRPDAVARVWRFVATEATLTLLVICRSGGRSALAANLLALTWLKNAYDGIDGMEGDAVHSPDSLLLGLQLKNGWKNSACPWIYKLTPERMLFPKVG